jgi:uncharacterized protein YjbJ (UPF0337 family)
MTSVIEAWGRHRLASRSMKSTEKDKAKTRRQQAGKKAFQEGILPGGPREQRLALLSFESKARGGVEGRARRPLNNRQASERPYFHRTMVPVLGRGHHSRVAAPNLRSSHIQRRSDRIRVEQLSKRIGYQHKWREQMGEIIDKAKGKIKQAAGTLAGDKKLEQEGKVDEAKGKLKGSVEDVKHAVKVAVKE